MDLVDLPTLDQPTMVLVVGQITVGLAVGLLAINPVNLPAVDAATVVLTVDPLPVDFAIGLPGIDLVPELC